MKRLQLCFCFLWLTVSGCNLAGTTPEPSPTPTHAPPQTSTVSTAPSEEPAAAFDPSLLGSQESDITYCSIGGVELKLDLYFPESMDGLWPVAVYVHGGAWQGGDKSSGAGYRDVPDLVENGYLVATINYRLAPEYRFPAMIEDVKCAIRYLRALVALLGVTDPGDGFEGQGGYQDQSSRVQAVVDMFGPADIRFLTDGVTTLRRVFGTADGSSPILELASPVIYASADDPPFLILHGTHDPVVPSAHSEALYEALSEAGAQATLVMVENAGHGFSSANGPIDPSRSEITELVVEFFDSILK